MLNYHEKALETEKISVGSYFQRTVLAAGVIGATLLQAHPGFCEMVMTPVAGDVDSCPDDRLKEVTNSGKGAHKSFVQNTHDEAMKKRTHSSIPQVDQWRPTVEKHAEGTVDPEFVMILLDLESKGDPEAESPVGAQGLLQIMPTTAPDIAERLQEDSYDIFNPETNIKFATEHIRWLIEDVGVADGAGERWPLYVAASYNFGHGAAEIIASGNFEQLPEETKNYALNAQKLYEQLES